MSRAGWCWHHIEHTGLSPRYEATDFVASAIESRAPQAGLRHQPTETVVTRSKSRTRALVSIGAVSSLLFLAACGSDDADSDSTDAPAATDAAASTEAPAATEAPADTEATSRHRSAGGQCRTRRDRRGGGRHRRRL